MEDTNSHIVMFPWVAIGHMNPFLQLSNKLAQNGYTISFLIPDKAIQQLRHFNLFPDKITFHPIAIPHVDGLPAGTETASDIPIQSIYYLTLAFDKTQDQVRKVIRETKPKFVFYDFSYWLPEIATDFGCKAIYFAVVCAASIAIGTVPDVNLNELSIPPSGYRSSTVLFRGSEFRSLDFLSLPFGDGITFYDRTTTGCKKSDAISMRTCDETEGKFCDCIGSQFKKPVFLTGPILPDPPETPLEDRWEKWLNGFEKKSVVFCAFGSQFILEKHQFKELVLGFEATGLPFLVAVKPPLEFATVEEALPEGFEERVKGRGVVYGGWVEQVMGDQILNTRLLVDELKMALEVERDENGLFTKEDLSKAIKCVMDKDSELASTLNNNHTKWREILANQGLLSDYIDKFVDNI